MTPRVQTLEVAQSETLRWCVYLQTVADAIPRGAWLNSMTAVPGTNPEDPAVIKLNGVAATADLVSNTLMNLTNKSPLLQNVTLKSQQDLPPANGQTVTGKTFTIETNLASVIMPEPPPTQKKEKSTNGSS